MKQIHHITVIFSIILFTIHFLLKLKWISSSQALHRAQPRFLSVIYKYKRTYRLYITVKLYWINERSALQNTFCGKYWVFCNQTPFQSIMTNTVLNDWHTGCCSFSTDWFEQFIYRQRQSVWTVKLYPQIFKFNF